jgi:hypothetical protein
VTFPCCPIGDFSPDHSETTFAERHAAFQAERDDRMGVPDWGTRRPRHTEHEVQAG